MKTIDFVRGRDASFLRRIKAEIEEQMPFLVGQESDEASGYREAILIRAAAELDDANPAHLAEVTGYPVEFVSTVAKRMQDSKIWVDDKPDLQELEVFDGALLIHMGVARGWLVRKGLRGGSPTYGPGPELDRKPKWMMQAEAPSTSTIAGVPGLEAELDNDWLRSVAKKVVETAECQSGNSGLDENQRQALVHQITIGFGPVEKALLHGECVFCAFSIDLHQLDTHKGPIGFHKNSIGRLFVCNSWVLSEFKSRGQVLPIS